MLTHQQAHALIDNRLPAIQSEEGGLVTISGKWRLHELEALCVIIRQELSDDAVGAEEYLAKAGAHSAKIPYAKIEAIVRRYYDALRNTIAQTILEDVAQLSNPGSSPVYGTPLTGIKESNKLSFTGEALYNLTRQELLVKTTELCADLINLGCSIPTLTVASGMLGSAVLKTDQEKLMQDIDAKRKR